MLRAERAKLTLPAFEKTVFVKDARTSSDITSRSTAHTDDPTLQTDVCDMQSVELN